MSQLGLNMVKTMVKTMAIFADHHAKQLMIQWSGGRPIFRQTHRGRPKMLKSYVISGNIIFRKPFVAGPC
jgi:hypothetical protein